MSEAMPYTVGGTVQAGSGLYLPRKADQVLFDLCCKGTFAYVLTPRQMGKSSLMVRCASDLAKKDVSTVIIDLTQIGVKISAESWYLGLIAAIEDQLDLHSDIIAWWQEQADRKIGIVQRLTDFFEKILLKEVNRRIVIFIDEIDTTLSLDFTDDFFAAIRYFYNARSYIDAFQRLSFVLIGVATPSDLIRDAQRTPFNIGERVDLTDFNIQEAEPLARGLCENQASALAALNMVIDWTGGHPYLTQRLCSALASQRQESWTHEQVARVVADTFFGERSEYDNNLQFVRDMLTRRPGNETTVAAVLELYRTIHRGKKKLPDEEQSVVKSHLKLSGIVRVYEGYLIIRNAIYRRVFDQLWISQHLPVNWTRRLQRAAVAVAFTLLCLNVPLTIYGFWQTSLAVRQRERAEAREFEARTAAQALRVSQQKLKEASNIAQDNEAKAKAQAKDAENARTEANFQRALAVQEAAKANALRLEREADDYARDGDYPEAQQRYAERIRLAAISSSVRDTPENRAKFIDMQQQVTTHPFRVWDLTAKARGYPVFSRDGKLLAIGGSDGSLRIIKTDTGRIWKTLKPPGAKEIQDLAFLEARTEGKSDNERGIELVAADQDGAIHWCDLSDCKPIPLENTSDKAELTPTSLRVSAKQSTVLEQEVEREDAKGHTSERHIASPLTPHGGLLRKAEVREPAFKFLGFSPDGAKALVMRGRSLSLEYLGNRSLGRINLDESPAESGSDPPAFSFSPNSSRLALIFGDSNRYDFRPHIVVVDTATGEKVSDHRELNIGKVAYDESNNLVPLRQADDPDKLAPSISSRPAFSQDGLLIAYADQNGVLHVRNRRSNTDVFVDHPSSRERRHSEVCFGPSQSFAVVHADGSLSFWMTKSSDSYSLPGKVFALNPQGHEMASADEEGTIRIWKDGPPVLLEGGQGLRQLVYSPNGHYLLATHVDGRVDLWDLETKDKVVSLPSSKSLTPRFTFDSSAVVYGSNIDNSWRVFSLTGSFRRRYQNFRYQLMDVALTADESRLIVTRADVNSIAILDYPGMQEIMSLAGVGSPVLGAVPSPRQKRVASRHLDGEILIWDLSSGKPAIRITAHAGPVASISYDYSGTHLASVGGDDHLVKIWDGDSGSLLASLVGNAGRVTGVKFAPDGKMVASSGEDGSIRIFDLATCKEINRFQISEEHFLSLDWSRDGRWIVAGSDRGDLRLIDARTGREEASTHPMNIGNIYHVTFTRDGNRVISASEQGVLAQWDLSSARPVIIRTVEPRSAVNGLAVSDAPSQLVYGLSSGILQKRSDPDIGNVEFSNADVGTGSEDALKVTEVHDVANDSKNRGLSLEKVASQIQVVDPKNRNVLLRASMHSDDSYAELSPDGRWLAYEQHKDALRLISLGFAFNDVGGISLEGAGSPAAFSSDGHLFAYTSHQRLAHTLHKQGVLSSSIVLIHIVDAQTLSEIGVIPSVDPQAIFLNGPGHIGVVQASDGSARVWDLNAVIRYYHEPGTRLLERLKQTVISGSNEDNSEDGTSKSESSAIDSAYRSFRAKRERLLRMPRLAQETEDISSLYKKLLTNPNGRLGLSIQLGSRIAPFQHLLFSSSGHAGQVTDFAISQDGDLFATSSADGTAEVWNAATGLPISVVHHGNTTTMPGGAAVVHVEFDRAGKRLLTASLDGSARLWNSSSGALIRSFDTHLSGLVSATFSPDEAQVLTCSVDKTARLYDTASGTELRRFELLQRPHWAGFTADGRRIVVTGVNGGIWMWNVDGRVLLTLAGHSSPVRSISLSPTDLIAAGGDDRIVHIYSLNERSERTKLIHAHSVSSVQFSPDGRFLLSLASGENLARIWDTSTGLLYHALIGHTGTMKYAKFDRSGKYVITTAADGKIKVWNVQTGRLIASYAAVDQETELSLSQESRVVIGAQVLTGEKSIVAVSANGSFVGWSFVTSPAFADDGDLVAKGVPPDVQQPIWEYDHRYSGTLIRYSADGKKVLTTDNDGKIQVQNLDDGSQIASFSVKSRIPDVDFSPDSKAVIAATARGVALVWDISKPSGIDLKPKFSLQHQGRVRTARYNPDGSLIVTSSSDGTVRLWSAESGAPGLTIKGHGGAIRFARFNSDGTRLLLTENGEISIYDSRDGRLLKIFRIKSVSPRFVSFSPNDRAIVAVSDEGTLDVWDTESGSSILSISSLGHISSAVFTPDSKKLLSGTNEGVIVAWDLADIKRKREMHGHNDLINTLSITMDGKYLASTSDDGSAIIWDLAKGDILERITLSKSPSHTIGVISQDGAFLVGAGTTGAISCWSISVRSQEDDSWGQASEIRSIASLAGKRVASLDIHGHAAIWDANRQGDPTLVPTEQPVEVFSSRSSALVSIGRKTEDGWSAIDYNGRFGDVIIPARPRALTQSITPDGKRLLIATERSISIWDTDKGKLISRYKQGGDQPLSWAQISHDGSRVFTETTDGTLLISDSLHGIKQQEIYNNSNSWSALSPSGQELLFGGDGYSPVLINLKTGRPIRTFARNRSLLIRLQFSDDGNEFCGLGDDYRTSIWDVATGRLIRTFGTENQKILQTSLSPNGRLIAIAGTVAKDDSAKEEPLLEIYEVRSGTLISRIEIPDYIWAMTFNRGGSLLLTGDNQGVIQISDVTTGSLLWKAKQPGSVETVAFVPNGETFVTSHAGGDAWLWGVDTDTPIRRFGNYGDTITVARLTSDGKLISTFGELGTVRIWEVQTGKEVQAFGYDSIRSIFASSDSLRTVSSGSDGWLKVFSDSNHTIIEEKFLRPPSSVAFSHDGERFIAGFPDGQIKAWDLEGKTLGSFKLSEHSVDIIGFGRSTEEMFSITNGTISFFNTEGKVSATLEPEIGAGGIAAIDVHPDQPLAVIALGKRVEIWDLLRKCQVATLPTGSVVTAVQFSNDGGMIFAGSQDGAIRKWDLSFLNFEEKDVRRALGFLHRK